MGEDVVENTGEVHRKYVIAIASNSLLQDDYNKIASVVTKVDKDFLFTIDRLILMNKEIEALGTWGTELDKQYQDSIITIENQSRIIDEQLVKILARDQLQIGDFDKLELEKAIASIDEFKKTNQQLYQEKFHLAESLSDAEQNIIKINAELNGIKLKLSESMINEAIQKDKIDQLSQDITTHEINIAEITKKNGQLKEDLEKVNELVTHLDNELLKQNAQIDAYKTLIVEGKSQLQKQSQTIGSIGEKNKKNLQEKELVLQGLRQSNYLLLQENDSIKMRLQEIYTSDGWRLLKKYYNLKGKLLPENTSRYKNLKKCFNYLRPGKNFTVDFPKKDPPAFTAVSLKEIASTVSIEYPSLTVRAFEHPEVSIIIPAFNAWEMNYQCISSILDNTTGVSYEIILADDCSTDATKDCTTVISNLKHVRSEQNTGFLINCNNAAATIKGKYLLFLNNDTKVTPNWLSSLVTLMESDPATGMVGSKLIYPDGSLQEAGGIIWKDASGWNYGHKKNPALPEYNYVKEVDYISGACILIKKEAWIKAGGFDERYTPAYCEDSDFAFLLRSIGYKVMYQPLSEVIHYEGYSHGTDNSLQLTGQSVKAYQKINNEKFLQKWKDVLSREQFPNAVNVFKARDRTADKKTILVIDHYVPHYDKDAGSKTVFSYLKLFTRLGLNIKFIGDNFFQHEPYTSVLQQMGIEVLYGTWYHDNWSNWIKDNADQIDFIYINRPHISIKYIDFIKNNTTAKILYYGHDLHFVRERKQYEVEKKSALLESAAKWEKTERYIFDRSDIILTPSIAETNTIRSLDASYKVETILPYFFKEPARAIGEFAERVNILFVGGFGHSPNLDGVNWFCDNVWEKVRQQLPFAKFTVVGSNPPEELMQRQSDSIDIKGFVTEEQLTSIYSKTKLVVVPLRYGAGVKGKTVEAMYYGIPIVSTSFGTEGIPGEYAENLAVYDNAENFANEIVRLYSDNDCLSEASARGVHDINQYFTEDAAIDKMKELLCL